MAIKQSTVRIPQELFEAVQQSEEFSPQAVSLVEQSQAAIIVPAFAWVEVGSALRKKVRMGAAELSLPTLYDASFLAAAELAADDFCPFRTADEQLVGALAPRKP